MIKKKHAIAIFLIQLFLFSFTITNNILITEPIMLQPWTLENSATWNILEQEDQNLSFFRRNLFFEDEKTIITRDKNWISLCAQIYNHTGTDFIFPDLGFSIINTLNNDLIGSICLKLSTKPGFLSLGYGLAPHARNKKLGNEIIKRLLCTIQNSIGYPIATLKKDIPIKTFLETWNYEGKKEDPNFSNLTNMIDKQPIPFQGIIAFVNIINQPSLAVLVKNDMQPIEIKCSTYHIDNDHHLFEIDFVFAYPKIEINNSSIASTLIDNILSRDDAKIQNAHSQLKAIFSIPNEWPYLTLNTAEKKALPITSKTVSTIVLSKENQHKYIRVKQFFPPLCFIDS